MADRQSIVDERAAWAETFRNTPTNAVTRTRREADIAAARDQEALAREAQFETALTRDKGARDLFFGRERLRQNETAQNRLISRDAFDQEMRTKKMELDELNSQRLMQKELRDATNAKTILDQTIKAERDIDDNIFGGILPGTKEFADIALRTIARFPMMDPKARASILSSAKIAVEDEEFDTAWSKLTPAQKTRATVVDDPRGWRISVAPESAPKVPKPDNPDELFKEFRQAESDRAALFDEKTQKLKPGVDADTVEIFTSRRNALRDRIRGASATQTQQGTTEAAQAESKPPAAPKGAGTLVIADVIKSGGRALRNPANGETVFVDKDNNILGRLKPDGGK